MSFIICIRHAEIDLPRKEGDTDPHLNESGRRRAEALSLWVAPAGVRHIHTSGARRALETVAPLAQRLGLVPRTQPDLAGLVADLRAQAGDGVACVAGHSNTIPQIIADLGADASGLRIEEADFASLFIVSGAGSPAARALRLAYGGLPP